MKIMALLLRCIRRSFRFVGMLFTEIRFRTMLFINGVRYGSIHSNGMPYFCVAPSGQCLIGKNLHLNNGLRFNPIGFPQPCTIYVDKNARLVIGDNVGMSQASIICHYDIEVQRNVKLGGGTKIYDTDFHSLNPKDRLDHVTDIANKKKAKVTLCENCLIGAGTIILKGVTVGRNSIVGAGSVVTHSIPDNQIWAGNPARFIKNIQ